MGSSAPSRLLAGRELRWSDEFDGPAGSRPDPANWQLQTGGGGWGNEQLQYYTGDGSNVCLDGAGNLAIVAKRTRRRQGKDQYEGHGYTSGRLTSKGRAAFRYGLIRARIKLPAGRGLWPACWLLGADIDQVKWPGCGEIDLLENLGQEPAVIYGAAHGPGYTAGDGITNSCRAAESLAGDFHVYSVDWAPGQLSWYLDDELYAVVTPADLRGRPWVFDHDFFLLINLAVGGGWPGRPDRSVSFPQTMLVDYVRVYSPAGRV